MINAVEGVQKQQTGLPKAITSMVQMINNNGGGGESSMRQVTTPPENILEGQYVLFASNSTYNE